MKGIVFTEFIEMVEEAYSPQVADEMITSSELASNGVYTSVGTYDHSEMVQLVTQLSRLTETDVVQLLQKYGEFLFAKFVQGYPVFFEGVDTAFDLLKSIEEHIHIEVRKLYPDAELPTFEYEQPHENQLILIYRSPRGMGHFARGLINGCIHHFGQPIDVEQIDLSDGKGNVVKFVLSAIS